MLAGNSRHINRLPPEYRGERHVVVAKHLPSQFGQEWVEFEEVPGPDQNPTQESGVREYIDVVFVDSTLPSELVERAEQTE
jgi:hypothetical protein